MFFCFLLILDRDSMFFFCFLPIFDQEFFFLKHIHSLIVNEASFLGDPSTLSSEGEGRNSYPGSRFMGEGLRFWLKRACGRPDTMYVRVFVWQTVQKEGNAPHLFHDTHRTMMIYKFMQN